MVDKSRYTIRNLVTDKEYFVDVTHILFFYFDPAYVTPINIAVGYKLDGGGDAIAQQDFLDPQD